MPGKGSWSATASAPAQRTMCLPDWISLTADCHLDDRRRINRFPTCASLSTNGLWNVNLRLLTLLFSILSQERVARLLANLQSIVLAVRQTDQFLRLSSVVQRPRSRTQDGHCLPHRLIIAGLRLLLLEVRRIVIRVHVGATPEPSSAVLFFSSRTSKHD